MSTDTPTFDHYKPDDFRSLGNRRNLRERLALRANGLDEERWHHARQWDLYFNRHRKEIAELNKQHAKAIKRHEALLGAAHDDLARFEGDLARVYGIDRETLSRAAERLREKDEAFDGDFAVAVATRNFSLFDVTDDTYTEPDTKPEEATDGNS